MRETVYLELNPSLFAEGDLAVYVIKPRRLHDWRDHPPVPPTEGENDYYSKLTEYEDMTALDETCRKICDLPSMKGALQQVPSLKDLPLFYYNDSDDKSKGGSYNTATDENDVSFSAEPSKGCTVEQMAMAHLAHETRHGVQDLSGCFDVEKDPAFKNNFTAQFVFNRMIEADATVFSITIAYEYFLAQDDPSLLQGIAGFSRRKSVGAYWRACIADPQAHWDGRAAQAGFNAYFTRDNAGLLKNYDVKMCENFSERAQAMPRLFDLNTLDEAFHRYIMPMRRMPFEYEGKIYERDLYLAQPFNVKSTMAHFSHPAREIMRDARNGVIYLDL